MTNLKIYKLINILLLIALEVKKGSSVYNKENILILVVDDLRPLLVDWGDSTAHTPNIDHLAATSVIFKNAFCQQALCAPSRNSFLTGKRPDTLRLYDFYNYWREFVGNFTTLPQFFKEHDYKSYSFGKIFHPGKSSNFTDDYPYSWSEFPYHPSTNAYKNAKVCVSENSGTLEDNIVCPVIPELQPKGTLPDIQIAQAAIDKLISHKTQHGTVPFFMGIGFEKPHIPLKFPRKYIELYPLENMTLAKEPFRPASMATVAWNPWMDLRQRDDINKLNISFPFGKIPDEWALKIKQGYYSSISYIDDLIGDILKHIDFNKTIVVLTSDHGWSLGEHGEWAKYSNYDVALKVPLILHVPGMTDMNNVQRKYVHNVVELLDLFPTLAELSGLVDKFPVCTDTKDTLLCSEGVSLIPLINSAIRKKTNSLWKRPAFSQYPRPGIFPSHKPNSDKPKLKDISIMGYSIRTQRYRYTEWVNFSNILFRPDWTNVTAIELYDHKIDDGENINLSDRTELRNISKHLSKRLRHNWTKHYGLIRMRTLI